MYADTDWHYAYGKPEATGKIKTSPEDFRVTELLDISFSGDGEHCWLWVNKRLQNTEQVAKQLARFAGVAYRDVSYSGMKDFQAVTSQWFSIWLPGKPEPDWSNFQMDGVTIEKNIRHSRKLKRGSHSANQFKIVVRDIEKIELLEPRLLQIEASGAPNYFGEQRFGREANNIQQAKSMFESNKKLKDRHRRSLYLSAARAWLFNLVLSERVKQQNWNVLFEGEPVNLNASNSVFVSNEQEDLQERLQAMDIHPTAPMWGKGHGSLAEPLQTLERQAITNYMDLAEGLERAGLKHERRTLRIKPINLRWQIENSQCLLEFGLHKGQFATSILRECINSYGQ